MPINNSDVNSALANVLKVVTNIDTNAQNGALANSSPVQHTDDGVYVEQQPTEQEKAQAQWDRAKDVIKMSQDEEKIQQAAQKNLLNSGTNGALSNVNSNIQMPKQKVETGFRSPFSGLGAEIENMSKGNGALQQAGTTSNGAAKVTGDPLFENSQEAFNGVADFNNLLSNPQRTSGASVEELEKFRNSVELLSTNAIEKFNRQAQTLGTLQDINYAVSNPSANVTEVAKYLADAYGFDNEQLLGIKATIQDLKRQHTKLSPAVIGMVLNKHLESEAQRSVWSPEKDVARGLSYDQEIFGDNALEQDLKALEDPKNTNNYEHIKDAHARLKNMFSELGTLDTQYQMAQSAVAKQIQNVNNYGANPASTFLQNEFAKDANKSREASLALAQNAMAVFDRIQKSYGLNNK